MMREVAWAGFREAFGGQGGANVDPQARWYG